LPRGWALLLPSAGDAGQDAGFHCFDQLAGSALLLKEISWEK